MLMNVENAAKEMMRLAITSFAEGEELTTTSWTMLVHLESLSPYFS
jgi:hypothetical protein